MSKYAVIRNTPCRAPAWQFDNVIRHSLFSVSVLQMTTDHWHPTYTSLAHLSSADGGYYSTCHEVFRTVFRFQTERVVSSIVCLLTLFWRLAYLTQCCLVFAVRFWAGRGKSAGRRAGRHGRTDRSVDVCALTWTVLAYIILLETGINISPWSVVRGYTGAALAGPCMGLLRFFPDLLFLFVSRRHGWRLICTDGDDAMML